MKTNFESDEDKFFLQQILMRAVMTTENAFEPIMNDPQLAEYRKMVFATRAKIFEYLEIPDPNEPVIKLMQQQKNEQPESPSIILSTPLN